VLAADHYRERADPMRVIALPADETGCGSYRVIWPAAMVANAHPDWTVEIYRPADVKVASDRGRLVAVQGIDPAGADVVLMQRVGTPGTLALMRWFQEQGVAVVLDADDALWSIHRDNSAYSAWNREDHHWSIMDQAAREADLVTVTTRRLADRYGKHGRVMILPNRVPAGALELRQQPTGVRVLRFGWSGYVGTHPADLGVVGNAVSRVLTETPADALIIGDGSGILTAWGLREQAGRVTATGSLPLDAYYAGLSRLDVGMVPLEESVFNRCKSGLKAAEFAAVGVPVVVTPTPAHTALAREGFPLYTADSPREWHEQLTALLTVPEIRAAASELAYNAARRHTLENHIEEWAETWQRAAVRRTRLSA
jgi:glycosyltransferase involved in cell wall biosynthesis